MLWAKSLIVTVMLVCTVLALLAVRERLFGFFSAWTADDLPAPITAVARKTTIPREVLAGGELESADEVDVVCEVEGTRLKIVEMVPEGTNVESGQIVVRLDPSEIKDLWAQQRIKVTQAGAVAKAAAEELKIQRNLAESAIADAQLTVKLAELDRKKYAEGEYQVEFNDLQGLIALAETDLQDANDMVVHFEKLVRKGFRTEEQLEAKEQEVERAKYILNRDKEKLRVLERFTRERQLVELTAKAEETVRELERVRGSSNAAIAKAETDLEVAEATATLEREQLKRLEKQLELCDVRAPAAGTVIYAKDKNKKIELGAPVHFKQKLFSQPDLSRMQVVAFVHESDIQQVRLGMDVNITVEAFPDLPLIGKVSKIATYYDSTRHWLSGGVKDYATDILIEDIPADVALKPGMTAQVVIRIGELSEGVIVPIAAVAQSDNSSYCFKRIAENQLERVAVKLGVNNESHVEILSGLEAGDVVALDARVRQAAEDEGRSTSQVAGDASL